MLQFRVHTKNSPSQLLYKNRNMWQLRYSPGTVYYVAYITNGWVRTFQTNVCPLPPAAISTVTKLGVSHLRRQLPWVTHYIKEISSALITSFMCVTSVTALIQCVHIAYISATRTVATYLKNQKCK
jgi:hypothetical protein